jgi:membrane-associated protein
MNFITGLISFILHIDTHLHTIIAEYGVLTYAILFVIVFVETGLVVMPLLPGDSLLFAVGAFSARGLLNLGFSLVLLGAAAIIGATVNYWIGKKIGPKVFQKEDSRIFKKKYIDRTRAFYAKHGAKTIIMARFVPIVRTFAPFVAGVGEMPYRTFVTYNVAGGVMWVLLFTLLGYFFGNIPAVEENFSLVILAIIALSLVPPVIEFVRGKLKKPPSTPSVPQ